jgi:hypothetical protein
VEQFEPNIRNDFTRSAFFVASYFDAQPLSKAATAFFYNLDGKVFLVTARHNVTGRHNHTRAPAAFVVRIFPDRESCVRLVRSANEIIDLDPGELFVHRNGASTSFRCLRQHTRQFPRTVCV